MEYHSSSSKTKFSSAILHNIPSGRFCSSSISSTTYSALSFKKSGSGSGSGQKKSCMCSPTTHPGSFRCSLHKQGSGSGSGSSSSSRSIRTMSYNSHRLNARISAMSNSLVRIDKLKGVLVKRAVAALIRPSSNQQQRRKSAEFRPRPTRLSVMSKAQSL